MALQITITNSTPNPNGASAAVSRGGSVKWFGANQAYSLTLPTSVFSGVNNPVSVPQNGWSVECSISSTAATGEASYTISSGGSSRPPRDGQPSIMVQP
jgi:hypothetical protein